MLVAARRDTYRRTTRKNNDTQGASYGPRAVQHSGGRLAIVTNQEDTSDTPCMEAANFLKLDGRRIGRDLELYVFMMKVSSDPYALATVIEEILMPIKRDLPDLVPQVRGPQVCT